MKTQIAKLNSNSQLKSGSSNTENSTSETSISSAYLEQNTPNPFTESTNIVLFVPEKIVKASLYIYDLTGNQKDVIEIDQRGQNTVTIEANSLTPGMYLYSLICDGVLIGTKQMILTE